jgi:signal transduction histidine kinase
MDAELFLANTILTLATSPDFLTTIKNLARLAVPEVADWCGIFMFETEQTVRRLATAPAPDVESALYPLDLHASTGPAHVLRTGEDQLLTDITAEVIASLGLRASEFGLSNGSAPSVYLCTPLTARNRTIGAMCLISAEPKKHFSAKERALAAALANAAAIAIADAKLYREAQEANRLKDEFVAMVSHELRTPLTPILGCIHLLRTANLTKANFDRALEVIERNAHVQVQIVDDLLDASRIVAGKLHLTMRPTELIPVLEAAVDAVRPAAEAKGVQIVTDFEDVRQPMDGDSERLQQIVWNLLSNAVKFTPVDGKIELGLRAEGDQVQIRVADTGPGIPPDFMPYLFDRFQQGPHINSRNRSGLGLGLAIVRHLVELHNGSIEAASGGSGAGAVFTIKFPFAARKAASATS